MKNLFWRRILLACGLLVLLSGAVLWGAGLYIAHRAEQYLVRYIEERNLQDAVSWDSFRVRLPGVLQINGLMWEGPRQQVRVEQLEIGKLRFWSGKYRAQLDFKEVSMGNGQSPIRLLDSKWLQKMPFRDRLRLPELPALNFSVEVDADAMQDQAVLRLTALQGEAFNTAIELQLAQYRNAWTYLRTTKPWQQWRGSPAEWDWSFAGSPAFLMSLGQLRIQDFSADFENRGGLQRWWRKSVPWSAACTDWPEVQALLNPAGACKALQDLEKNQLTSVSVKARPEAAQTWISLWQTYRRSPQAVRSLLNAQLTERSGDVAAP